MVSKIRMTAKWSSKRSQRREGAGSCSSAAPQQLLLSTSYLRQLRSRRRQKLLHVVRQGLPAHRTHHRQLLGHSRDKQDSEHNYQHKESGYSCQRLETKSSIFHLWVDWTDRALTVAAPQLWRDWDWTHHFLSEVLISSCFLFLLFCLWFVHGECSEEGGWAGRKAAASSPAKLEFTVSFNPPMMATLTGG